MGNEIDVLCGCDEHRVLRATHDLRGEIDELDFEEATRELEHAGVPAVRFEHITVLEGCAARKAHAAVFREEFLRILLRILVVESAFVLFDYCMRTCNP